MHEANLGLKLVLSSSSQGRWHNILDALHEPVCQSIHYFPVFNNLSERWHFDLYSCRHLNPMQHQFRYWQLFGRGFWAICEYIPDPVLHNNLRKNNKKTNTSSRTYWFFAFAKRPMEKTKWTLNSFCYTFCIGLLPQQSFFYDRLQYL